VNDAEICIVGAHGQLGQAFQKQYPGAQTTDSDTLDITDANAVASYDWSGIKIILNAAAFTNVDSAETEDGGKAAWQVNDAAVGNLVAAAAQHAMTLVHVSTAYVFDGQKDIYTERDTPNPLGVYAKSKAAGEQRVLVLPKYYIIRTDSVIGQGKNFVRTMLDLAHKGVNPTVVADQIIRPTFTNQLVQAINFLLINQAEYGIYNVTNEGETLSWADFTRAIFAAAKLPQSVTNTTLADYAADKTGVAPRPLHSVLDLHKIEAAGFTPTDWKIDLSDYINSELNKEMAT
jgi:dTDP-4-dehydrorhamnose reductase